MAEATCWTLIEDAASGDARARDAFVARYLPVVRAYLEARWRGRAAREEVDDAVQEVFVECLKGEGVLDRNHDRRGRGFRAYLFGAVRNVALRVETERARRLDVPRSESFEVDRSRVHDETSSRIFDRAWAVAVMRDAAAHLAVSARAQGSGAVRRVELLRLVFQEGRRIADVAREWNVRAEDLHHEYARARAEFLTALRAVVAADVTGSVAAVERECRDLIRLLE